ncbi:MAG: tetraacyldisaccharide 4'-kinase, partial [Planctomycetota bacterium]
MKHTKAIMSGERSGLLASCLRAALLPASWGYGLGARWKNRGFDLGTVKVHRCGVPVISVGNVTTGGTGKTPVVCYLAQKIRQQGLRVAIVSRGYRSDADTGVNDEALELHDRLPDVPHVQDPDRVEAARVAVEELESEIILMDDGFQHRRLGRDLDIVLIDATCPFGFGHLLPRGLLREPLSSLGRADLIVISRCDQVDSTQLDRIRSVVQGIAPETPVIESEHRPSSLRGCRGDLTASDLLQGQTVALISGIGNPDAFQR